MVNRLYISSHHLTIRGGTPEQHQAQKTDKHLNSSLQTINLITTPSQTRISLYAKLINPTHSQEVFITQISDTLIISDNFILMIATQHHGIEQKTYQHAEHGKLSQSQFFKNFPILRARRTVDTPS